MDEIWTTGEALVSHQFEALVRRNVTCQMFNFGMIEGTKLCFRVGCPIDRYRKRKGWTQYKPEVKEEA